MTSRVLTIILILITSTCWGEIRYIQPGEVIQDAVNVSMDGDTVIIEEGLYEQTTILYGKDLIIGSRFLLDGDTSHIAATVISGSTAASDTMSCFVYAYGEGEDGRLVGLTMRDSQGTYWDSGEEYAGGAVYVIQSTANIERCIIRSTSSYVGGGIAACRVRYERETWLTLRNCIFDSCYCDTWGGGVYGNYAIVNMTGCEFRFCESLAHGSAAIFLDCDIAIDSCRFENCRCVNAHGALVMGDCEGFLLNSTFRANETAYDAVASHLLVGQSILRVSGCRFSESGSGQIAIHLADNSLRYTDFVGNVVENNVATVSTGTLLTWDGRGEIAYNIFRNNYNINGSAIQTYGSINRSHIHHNVFENNICPDPTRGSVLNNLPDSQPRLDSNIFRGNSAPAIVHWPDYTDSLDARNNWWGDASGPYHPTLNPNGLGDTLYSDSILFMPWLTVPPDTVMPESARETPALASTWEMTSVYPNPFNSEVSLEFVGYAGANFKITLHNLLGQTVETIHSGPLMGGKIHYTASPTLATGVYFVRAFDPVQMQTRKIVFLK